MTDQSTQGEVATRRPTLADVAAAASVSLKTASRALNGEPYVAAATQQRVLEAANALDFRFNSAASQLKRGTTTSIIGLVVGDLANPFSMAVAKGAESELRKTGKRLMMVSSDEDPELEQTLVSDLAQRHVDGVMLLSTREDHTDLAPFVERGMQFVFLDRPSIGVDSPSIVLDNAGGTAMAMRHLLDGGHTRIAFIGDLARLSPQVERFAAYTRALSAEALPIDEALIRDGVHDAAAAEQVTRDLLASSTPPTAIFTANNRITVGAVAAIRQTASSVALVGFDDFELADALGVTTVSSDAVELGRAGARYFTTVHSELPRRSVIPSHLTVRGSGERAPVA